MKASLAWLSAVGLVLDIAGVFVVGFVAEGWFMAHFDGQRHLNKRRHRVFYKLAWAAIVAGFFLQLIPQIWKVME